MALVLFFLICPIVGCLSPDPKFCFVLLCFALLVCFVLRERNVGGEAEREEERESQAGYTLNTEPGEGLNFITFTL